MAFQTLTVQVNGSQHFSQWLTLDDVLFRLDFYVTRVIELTTGEVISRWYLDLYDGGNSPIVMGIGVTTGIDILFPYRAYKIPAGKLFVYPNVQVGNGTGYDDPTETTFEEDLAFVDYQTEAEVEAMGLADD